MSFSQFTKNENKSIVWGLLQEGGIFNDIPNKMFPNIKINFENSMLSMKPEFDIFFNNNDEGDDDYDKKASEMIVNSNKTVIKKMMDEVGKFKTNQKAVNVPHVQQSHPQYEHAHAPAMSVPPRFNGGNRKSRIEEIYRADDIKQNRMSDLEIRLKEKQEEMNTMLNNKKPALIDFSDKNIDETKLSSNDMDKLLAEALSYREREFDKPIVKDELPSGREFIPIQPTIDVKRHQVSNNKNVSFNEKKNIKITYDIEKVGDGGDGGDGGVEDATSNDGDGDGDGGLHFLSKIKRSTSDSLQQNNKVLYNHPHIPLDNFTSNTEDNEDTEDNEENYGSGINNNNNLFLEMRDAGDAGEYRKITEKIDKLETDIEEIKTSQKKILDILSTYFTQPTISTPS